MARLPVIVLIAVLAVAWPAAATHGSAGSDPNPDRGNDGAHGHPVPPVDPHASGPPVTAEQENGTTTFTVWMPDPSSVWCDLAGCQSARTQAMEAFAPSEDRADCRAAQVYGSRSFPYYYVTFDPDRCIRDFVEKLPPGDLPLPAL